MFSNRLPALIIVLTAFCMVVKAQQHSFLFTLVPPDQAGPPVVLQYDAAYGRETFEPLGGDNVEQTLGVQARLSESLLLMGRLGFATTNVSTLSSQQVELLVRTLSSENNFLDVSLGPGFRHEYSGTNVLLGRIIVGRHFASSDVYGNMLFEKPFSPTRDDIDLVLTLGWSYSVSTAIRVGIEGVGQDLEGFWEENEAEGGARLFVGPTLAAAIPATPWTFTLGAGPILRATQNSRFSSALRDLPLSSGNGFVIHAAIRFGL
jgi:hypothetical protein